MNATLQKLQYGKQYGYEVLFKHQEKHATGKPGVIVAELGMPEDYEAAFYSQFMEHVFRYTLPPFLVKLILADKGIGLIDPDNPLAREEFKPKQLVDVYGSSTNKAGVPYVQCEYIWKPANLKNPWDHGYFLYTGDGPNSFADICDKVGAKVVGWYYGKLLPEKKVPYRYQLHKVYEEAAEELTKRFPGIEFRSAHYMDKDSIQTAVEELIAAGCQTIIYLAISCPIYSDFEDYGHALPMIHELVDGRACVIMADQLGSQAACREAYLRMLQDQLSHIPPKKSVLVILSKHGHPFKKDTQDIRACLYREPLEAGVREIMACWEGKWEVLWSCDEYADSYWDKNHKKFETHAAYRRAIEEGFDFAIEIPTEFTAENTDLMIFHAMKKFNAFTEYDQYAPVPYPNWEEPLVRQFTEGKTTGIYAGTPVGPYRKYIVKAAVDSISEVIQKRK